MKGGLYPSVKGVEAPLTLLVRGSGRFYTFGTSHKGVLANLGAKTGAFGGEWDELAPYASGAVARMMGSVASNGFSTRQGGGGLLGFMR